MSTSLPIVLPIFALILVGWLARRVGALGPNATSEVNKLVVQLALPALLFDIVANADATTLWQPGFIATFGGGCAAVFASVVLFTWIRGRHLSDASLDALNASYANTGFVGFPLMAAVVGPQGLAPTLIATVITVCILFAVAIVLIEINANAGSKPHQIVGKTLLSLARNPLLLAPSAGLVCMWLHVPIPAPAQTFLTMLGAVASPCALIALGLFLADAPKSSARPPATATAVLAGLKLVVQPLTTWVIAKPVLGLDDSTAHIAVLLAALPTGTGPFMLAEFYRREAGLTARVVLVTTILSLASVPLYLAMSG
nr:AEC family transporter [uncultured Devosia sp.]